MPLLAAWFKVPMRIVEQQPYAAGLRFNERAAGAAALRRRAPGRRRTAPRSASSRSARAAGSAWSAATAAPSGCAGAPGSQAGDEVLAFADPDLDVTDLFEPPRRLKRVNRAVQVLDAGCIREDRMSATEQHWTARDVGWTGTLSA